MDLTKVWNRNPKGNLRQMIASKKKGGGIQRNKILQEPELKSVEEGALLNPLILKKVLGYLDNAGDLLNCRLVCTDWKSLANEILLKRRSLTISLAYDEKTGAFFKTRSTSPHFSVDSISSPQLAQSPQHLQNFPLKNLLHLMKSSEEISFPYLFPCVSFQIVAGDLEADDLSSFLHFYGEKVEKLGLTFCHYKRKKRLRLSRKPGRVFTKVSSVQNLLCRQLPNLKELEIFNTTDYQFYDLLGRESFAFHNLFEDFKFEMESSGTETRISTALSPGNQKAQSKMMMIARLPKLEKLCCSIFKYHDFHTFSEYSENEDAKNVILKNMMESKTVEFYGFSDVTSTCKDCVKALISKNKVCELENLSIKDLGLELMEKVLEKCPAQLQFNELYTDFDVDTVQQLINNQSMKKRMIRVLNTVFNCATTNSNAKKIRVQFGRPIGFLSDFEIPVMENVSHLILSKLQRDDERELQFPPEENGQMLNLADISFPFFPCGFTLSDSFPNLRNVWLLDWTRDISSDLLGSNCQVLPTVKDFYLEWASFEPLKGFSKLPQVFPNLTKIKIEHINNFGAVAPFLWKFKKLEELTIGLFVGSSAMENSNANKLGAVDSAITGFTMETCQKLWESEEFFKWAKTAAKDKTETNQVETSGAEWSGFESLRVNPSICDLPKLKEFSVKFWDGDLSQKESYFLISELSGLFAFDLMPQLEVNLIPAAAISENDRRMREHLEKMEPYVKV